MQVQFPNNTCLSLIYVLVMPAILIFAYSRGVPPIQGDNMGLTKGECEKAHPYTPLESVTHPSRLPSILHEQSTTRGHVDMDIIPVQGIPVFLTRNCPGVV